MKLRSILACAVLAAFPTTTRVIAHHSISGVYQTDRQITKEGVIKKIQFVNPHPLITISVTDKGKDRSWTLELDNLSELVEIGMDNSTFKPGDRLSALNLVGGVFTVVIPLIIIERLQLDKTVVGLTFAAQGLTATASAFFFGRVDTRNRERRMLVAPMLGTGIAVAALLFESSLPSLIAVMAITGLLNGPLDIALFTLRQRRTDRSWTGRAFAISMAFNYTGIPIGAAIGGIVATLSIEAAIGFGAIMCLTSGVLASILIPSTE